MKTSFRILFALALLGLANGTYAAEDQFPVRELYPKVVPMELEELHAKLGRVIVIDARFAYEYETLHIKDAINIPFADPDFKSRVQQLRDTDIRPIVFYCNGKTCKVSYKAAQAAQHAGVKNVYAYDAGIFDWVKAYPKEAVLLGRSPVDLKELISSDELKAHMLPPEKFAQRIGDDTIVLDVRSFKQKDLISLFPMRQRSVPLDNEKLISYVRQAKREGKTLLIYDAVGKQVRWVQYLLKREGVPSYYFMEGGARAFFKSSGKR